MPTKTQSTVAAGRQLEAAWIPPMVSSRPPLVFLHEGLGSLQLWKDFPEQVARATGCGALVYSRYGYGWSDLLTERRRMDYMHCEALDSLPEVLAAFAITRPVLIGHSDGASIAIIHAGAHCSEVAGLVLMAPHVFVEDLTVRSIAAARTTFATTSLADRLARYHADPVSTFGGWNDIWLDPAFRTWNIEDYLPAIGCPVLAIQGENDEYGTLDQIHAIEQQVSGPVEKLILPACGHSPHRDQPQATLAAITRFIAALAQHEIEAKR